MKSSKRASVSAQKETQASKLENNTSNSLNHTEGPATLEHKAVIRDKAARKHEVVQHNVEFWDMKKVVEKTTLARQTIKDRMRSDKNFPRPFLYSQGKLLWVAQEIVDYLLSLPRKEVEVLTEVKDKKHGNSSE